MISSLGGASPTTPAFTFVNPQDPTAPLPSNGLFMAAGTEVSAQEVNDDPGDDVGGGILTTSGVKGTLQTYSATATLISSKLDNSEGEFYGTAVLGYVDHVQAQTQETWTNAKDVYNSRGQVVGAFGLENGAYVVEDAQGTQDMTSLLESSGESWTQQRAAMAQQSVDGADWNGSSDLQSIEATLAQFTLLQGEKGEAASATTDVYDANGNYVASFAEVWQQGSGGLFDSITATGGADEIERPLSGAGIDFATQDAVIQQQTQPTVALMNSLDTIVNTAGTMLLDQNRKHPWYAMQDSYGTAVAPGATISPIYDANGNYVGSTGIDPATGVAAQWDGDGNITLDAPPATPLSSWTQSQIQGFTPAVIAQITPTQMGGLSATQLGWFSPQQTAIWSSAQVAGINPSQIGGITANDLLAISPQAIAGLTAAQINNMSSSQLAEMTSGQVSQIAPSVISGIDVQHMSDIRGLDGLSAAQVAQINIAAIPNLNAYGFGVISPAAFAGFSAAQINNMTASQLAAATSEQVAQISPSVVAGIDVQHMDEIRGLDGLSAAQVAQINVAAIPGLNSYGFGVISPEAFAGFSAAQINTMTSEQLASMTSEQVSQILPSVIGGIDVQHMDEIRGLDGMSAAQVAQINVNAIPGLNSYGFSVISPAAFAGFSAAQTNNMSLSQIAAITSAQVSQISPAAFAGFSAAQINNLGSSQLGALTGDQAAAIRGDDIASIADETIAALSGDALSGFDYTQLAALSPSQIQSLSVSQLGAIDQVGLSIISPSFTNAQLIGSVQNTAAYMQIVDRAGQVVSIASLNLMFDDNGNYVGATGIDPSNGEVSAWNAYGVETTISTTEYRDGQYVARSGEDSSGSFDSANGSDLENFLGDSSALWTNINQSLQYFVAQQANNSSFTSSDQSYVNTLDLIAGQFLSDQDNTSDDTGGPSIDDPILALNATASTSPPLGPNGQPLPVDSNGMGYNPFTGKYDVPPGWQLGADGYQTLIGSNPNLQVIGTVSNGQGTSAPQPPDPTQATWDADYQFVSTLQNLSNTLILGILGPLGAASRVAPIVSGDTNAFLTAKQLQSAAHIFNRTDKPLANDLLQTYNGNVANAYSGVLKAAQDYVDSADLSNGYFTRNWLQTPVIGNLPTFPPFNLTLNGINFDVQGQVENGVFEFGTILRP